MSKETNFIDLIKWIVGISIPLIVTVGIMWWKGLFTKIKEEGKKQVDQIKKESALEQTDAVYDVLLKNIVDQVKVMQENHAGLYKSVSGLEKDVAVMERDIKHLTEAINNLNNNINNRFPKRR